MSVERFTLYGNRLSPFTHRVLITLKEAKATYAFFEIDPMNKPAWFVEQVNPAGKVPVIVYGGPETAPEQPSPESLKLPESAILMEFIHDLYPTSGLLPSDPVQRAQIRLFIDAVNNKFLPAQAGFIVQTPPSEDGGVQAWLDAATSIQALLEKQSTTRPYFLGEQFSIADAAIAPFLLQAGVFLGEGIGKFKASHAKKVYDMVMKDEKYARLAGYWKAISERESAKETFHKELFTEVARARLGIATD